jgi:hypothetical protein
MNKEELRIHSGKLIILNVFDHGGQIEKEKLCRALSCPISLDWDKPVEIKLSETEGIIASKGEEKTCRIKVYSDLFPAGSSIIRVEVEFNDANFAPVDLTRAVHSPAIYIGGEELYSYVNKRVEEAREKLRPNVESEYLADKGYYPWITDYTILKVSEFSPKVNQNELKRIYGSELTLFLSGEASTRILHGKEIAEKLSHDISYYDDELFLAAYEYAFVWKCDDYFNELLRYIELALSLSLTFHAYDWRIDHEIEEAYNAIKLAQKPLIFSQAPRKLEKALLKVSEMHLDILDNIEDLMNPVKITPDWYYQSAYERILKILKVNEFEKIVEQKIHTLQELYNTSQEISYSKIAMILEILIVLLIAFEIVLFLWLI